MTPERLEFEVDGAALVRRNLACVEEASVQAYVEALREALAREFASDAPELMLDVRAARRERVHVNGGDKGARDSFALRARAVADAVKGCVPWPVYE